MSHYQNDDDLNKEILHSILMSFSFSQLQLNIKYRL